MAKNLLIISGEASGDLAASRLIRELKPLFPGASFWGIGGNRMKAEGAELLEHISNLSVVGAWEALLALPKILDQYKKLDRAISERKPDLAILIDYPGFNLKVAALLKKKGIPVIYYIIPQVWAWGAGRINLIKRYVSKALVIFKFEEELLKKHGIDCEFVGHPLVTEGRRTSDERRATSDNGNFTVALLPGSRKSEIRNLFPVMLKAAEEMLKSNKNLNFVLAESSNIDKALYNSFLSKHKDLNISRVTDDTPGALERADLAVITSGTATLEGAIAGVPMIITYRSSFLTAFLSRLVIKIPYVGLANIVAGKKIVPELMQEDATPQKISEEALRMLKNPQLLEETKVELAKVSLALGEGNTARKAALAVKNFIGKFSTAGGNRKV